jgi:hypothetical protein
MAATNAASEKAQELAKVQGAIDLLKTHQGESLMRPAIRLLLLMELQLYHNAMKEIRGSIDKIPMKARVYGCAGSLVHVSHHTTKNVLDEFLTSHNTPLPNCNSSSKLPSAEIPRRTRRSTVPSSLHTASARC